MCGGLGKLLPGYQVKPVFAAESQRKGHPAFSGMGQNTSDQKEMHQTRIVQRLVLFADLGQVQSRALDKMIPSLGQN